MTEQAMADRARDEEVLEMLRLRDLGLSHEAIGRRSGRPRAFVTAILQRVDRDLANSEDRK